MADENETVPGFGPDESPSFSDVVKAFTPPGTDFGEFKAALHSQGAPGRVSPQLVSMLNQAAAAGAIPGVPGEHTGPRCVRCEHRHTAPPGRACIEAEAFYGRSPHRRAPDLQLDEISAQAEYQRDLIASEMKRTEEALAAREPDFPPGMPSVSAVAAHEQYVDFRRGGFTKSEALELLANLIAKAQPDNSTDET